MPAELSEGQKTTIEPTNQIRFIERPAYPGDRPLRILQQLWRVDNPLQFIHYEWRDVPLVADDVADLAKRASVRPQAIREALDKARADFPEIFVSEEVLERRRRGLPDYEKPPLGQPPAFLQERGDDSLAKQLQQSMERNRHLSQQIAAVLDVSDKFEERIAGLLSQLPDGMRTCTIKFLECPKGHGRLSATNWVASDCPTCRIQKQQDALRYVAEGLGVHPANLVAVAKEGLEP